MKAQISIEPLKNLESVYHRMETGQISGRIVLEWSVVLYNSKILGVVLTPPRTAERTSAAVTLYFNWLF